MKKTKVYLGKSIKEQRKEVNLDQDILADYAGISKWTLSKIETGKANPSLDTLMQILDTLGLDLILQKREDGSMIERDVDADR